MLVDQYLVDADGCLAVDPRFEPAKGRAAGQGLVPLHGRLPHQIVAQAVMVVEVFIARRQPVNALPKKLHLRVGDQQWVAWVDQHTVQGFG